MKSNNIGGERLGSGAKMNVDLKTYNRSTHDLSYLWRSSMAAGTLVPFMTELALPGDTHDIELDLDGKTHPTIGPLFGSYKMQLDVFSVPIRLYNAKLHMNMLGIGLKMNSVYMPQMRIIAENPETNKVIDDIDNYQINASNLLSYLGIRGVGRGNGSATARREFNAIGLLAYFDIFKQYYANKQEENAWQIDGVGRVTNVTGASYNAGEYMILPQYPSGNIDETLAGSTLVFDGLEEWENTNQVYIVIHDGNDKYEKKLLTEVYNTVALNKNINSISATETKEEYDNWYINGWMYNEAYTTGIKLSEFPLKNIDDMRVAILRDDTEAPFIIGSGLGDANTRPYITAFRTDEINYYAKNPMQGLVVKTYQSDLFNNWIETEWIDGDNGINAVTAIDTSDGNFTIDTLNLANKVYNMLNRIAISGGTYDDWLKTVYTHDSVRNAENPIYVGSLIKEMAFEEVISNAEAGEQALGTLAGRGVMTRKNKGGKITVKTNEPSYIIGIASITPRVDYSQGNKWDVNLRTMDDLHKPELDEIGYQDLITDQMAWFDTNTTPTWEVEYKSAGKQPAWLNYMTNVNRVFGSFAEKNNEMFMTLNRRYEYDQQGITDVTTYIDPSKFNFVFADTRLDAQNFWVQIAVDITARRKMSAKIMPNL